MDAESKVAAVQKLHMVVDKVKVHTYVWRNGYVLERRSVHFECRVDGRREQGGGRPEAAHGGRQGESSHIRMA